jgi:hypothetical protein
LSNLPASFDREKLFSRAASLYLDLLEEQGKPPKLDALFDRLYKEYPQEYVKAGKRYVVDALRSPEFAEIMRTKRLDRLMYTLAARVTAAEMGHALGTKAGEELLRRLDETPDEIATRDLIALVKAGSEMVQSGAQAAGNAGEGSQQPQIIIQTQEVLMKMPVDRRAVLAQEYGRELLASVNRKDTEN